MPTEAITLGLAALRISAQAHRLQRAIRGRPSDPPPGLIKLPRGHAIDAKQLDALREWAIRNGVLPEQGERLVPVGGAESLA